MCFVLRHGFTKAHLQDTLRSQVEEELNMANDKIEAIAKQIDMRKRSVSITQWRD
jgi:hypothetical protein